ncbi:MAG: tetratricopeptide repeat protein [Cyanobacteria bacterium]|nr:tetratricopeptide repeat protein [Cyanobacteriota bacterium]
MSVIACLAVSKEKVQAFSFNSFIQTFFYEKKTLQNPFQQVIVLKSLGALFFVFSLSFPLPAYATKDFNASLDSKGISRVASVLLEPSKSSPKLVIVLKNGGLDPVFSNQNKQDGKFQLFIDGESAGVTRDFYKALQRHPEALTQHFKKNIPSVDRVKVFETTQSGLKHFKIQISSEQKIQPQILSNARGRIIIQLKPIPFESVSTDTALLALSSFKEKKPILTLSDSPSFGVGGQNLKFVAPKYSSEESLYQLLVTKKASPELLQSIQSFFQGNDTLAAQQVGQWLVEHPQDKQGLYLMSQIALSQGKISQGVSLLEKIIAQDKMFLPAWNDLIQVSLQDGQYLESSRLLRQATQQWPNNPDFMYQQGILLEAKLQLEESKNYYLKALAANPTHPTYLFRFGMACLKLGQADAATVAFKRVLQINPDHGEALKLLGFLAQKQKNYPLAEQYYQQSLKPDALIGFAVNLQKQEKFELAASLLKAAEQMAPNDPDTLYNVGMAYVQVADKVSARRTLKKFLTLSPSQKLDQRHLQAEKALRAFP